MVGTWLLLALLLPLLLDLLLSLGCCLSLLLLLLRPEQLRILMRSIGGGSLPCCSAGSSIHCRLHNRILTVLQQLPRHLANHVCRSIRLRLPELTLNVLQLRDVGLVCLLWDARTCHWWRTYPP